MHSNVSVAEATDDEAVLPECVQEALGQLVGAAREGLLALSVSVGLGVLSELLEEEVTELVGPKGRWNPGRTAVRHGHEDGEVTLGGRRVAVKRPRVRTADGESELPLVTYQHFADRDQLGRVVLERMLAGVSTRKYRRAHEPVGEPVSSSFETTRPRRNASSSNSCFGLTPPKSRGPSQRPSTATSQKTPPDERGFPPIGETGFEPATARPPAGCATRLRHSPWWRSFYGHPQSGRRESNPFRELGRL